MRDLVASARTFRITCSTGLIYEVTKPITNNDQLRTMWGKARMGLHWLLFAAAPWPSASTQGAAFCRALPESETPDIQFHFGTLSADLAGGKVHDFSGCTYSVCQLRPESRGYVRIKSRDPFEAPSMQPNYLSTELDRRTAVAGVKFARRIAATEPMATLMKREFRPGHVVNTDDEILHFCREFGATIFHPTGTARMGRANDPLAVVDERLRVHGVPGCAWSMRRSCPRWCRATPTCPWHGGRARQRVTSSTMRNKTSCARFPWYAPSSHPRSWPPDNAAPRGLFGGPRHTLAACRAP